MTQDFSSRYQGWLMFFISRGWQTFLTGADSKYFRLCAVRSAKAAKDNVQMKRHHSVPIKFYFKNRSPGATDPPI